MKFIKNIIFIKLWILPSFLGGSLMTQNIIGLSIRQMVFKYIQNKTLAGGFSLVEPPVEDGGP